MNFKNKQKILQSSREKVQFTYRVKKIISYSGLSHVTRIQHTEEQHPQTLLRKEFLKDSLPNNIEVVL